jgi:hypothetical protein
MAKKFITISVRNNKLRLFSQDIKKVYSRSHRNIPQIPAFYINDHKEDRLPKVEEMEADSS